MKVFISWSGETSKALAEILRKWLPAVIQAVKPYYSPDDITKGTRWGMDLSAELAECEIGLICLTPDNLEAPWIMFEAGALSKSLTRARVCPLLFNVHPSEIKGPLVQFQAAPFTKEELKKTVSMINGQLGESALSVEVLESGFEMWWPSLETSVSEVLSQSHEENPTPTRTERDILEEILVTVRSNSTMSNFDGIHPKAYRDLRRGFDDLVRACYHLNSEEQMHILKALDSMLLPINYITKRKLGRGVEADSLLKLLNARNALDRGESIEGQMEIIEMTENNGQ